MEEDSSIGSNFYEEDDGELFIFDDLYYCDEESFELVDVPINKYDDNPYIQNLVQTATRKVEMVAFYKDVRDAIKAAQIHCLTQVAKMKQPEHDYPNWVKRYIQKRESIEVEDKSHPKFNGIVLVSNLNKRRKFFGYLDLDSTKLRLMIPVDHSENLTIPWQDFYFKNTRL